MARGRRASGAPGIGRHAADGSCPGALLFRLLLSVLCAAGIAASAAAVPVYPYPCLIQAEDYGAGGEGAGYHDTTPGNWGGAYREDDVDIWAEEEGFFVMKTAPGEWLGYDFWVDSANTEHYPIPVLLRVMSDRQEARIGVGVDGATPWTFPIWTAPGAWSTQVVQIPYPATGQHQLRVAFPDGDVWLDSVELADNHASGWGDCWGGDPGLAASATPLAGCAPLTVRFSDRSRPYPMFNWRWTFGDGNVSREQNPVHVYTEPGEYTVQFSAQASSHWSGGPPFMWIALWDMVPYPISLGSPITVYPPPSALPGQDQAPRDPDGDGRYEDLNGNGRTDFADVVLYFDRMDWIAANGPAVAFDQNGNGRVDFADVVALFDAL